MTNNTTNTDNSPRSLLTDPDRQLRLRAVMHLGATRDADAAEALVARLGVEEDFNVREQLTWAVVQVIDSALPLVLELLTSADPLARRQAAHVLSKVGAPELAPHVIGVVGDSDREVAVKAYRAAASTGSADVIPALIGRLGHGDLEQRDALSVALQRLSSLAVPALVEALTDPEAKVREHAADALGHLGDPDAAEATAALAGLLDDPVAAVRFAALSALGELEGDQVDVALATAALADDPGLRSLAAQLNRRGRRVTA
ncbi:MAG: HEAT repeat domain-containing protein [Micropruina sp.]|nr:HEAT repeat domain-containing protein [Micropruina sp.]